MFFKSVDKLFEQSAVKKFIYNDTGLPVAGYDDNIKSYSNDKDVDFTSNLNVGATTTLVSTLTSLP